MKSQATWVWYSNVLLRIFSNHYPDHWKEYFKFSVSIVAPFQETIVTDKNISLIVIGLGPTVAIQYNIKNKIYIQYRIYHAIIFYEVPSQI